ncbi:ArfGap-domain-containing protein [Zalerion maritima]|uniref:ArfGap-domain-containing protein n=1 Tax=Zalerion maritima TaxID=339359 RepID=A0AAD5RLY0_9PEZI|nr:ArfGap-domain-containing protein [Zalerion maritima]
MSGAMSKRQAARNEKALQDLVHKTTGNNICADCGARNPAWASWSLGIFLCMRCAAIHRKLGTHISKVKSISMDSWSNEQVDNMRKVGNLASNKIYNPQGKKPPVPIDADEADSAMERFIRQKYMNGGFKPTKRNSHGSTVSDEGTPPPLPPKTPSKFGLKSASSFLSLGSRKKDRGISALPSRDGESSPRTSQRRGSSPPRDKPSKGFGVSVDYSLGDEMEKKMASLRDMGFTDDQRNVMILKGMHGNMEKTVEALVRLGEGGRSSSLQSPQDTSVTNRSLTPTTMITPLSHGLSLGVSSPISGQRPVSSTSNNPFDNIKPIAQPQSSQSTGTIRSTNNPFLQQQQQQQQQVQQIASTNPFGMPGQQQNDFGLAQSFQNMSLSPAQTLFPHHTGGVPAPQPTSQPYQQSMTPPVQLTQSFPTVNSNSNMSYPPVQPLKQQPTGYNPFLQPQSSQSSAGLALNTNGVQGTFGMNPFARSPTRMQSPSPLAQIPETVQQNVYGSSVAVQSPSTNPFLATPTSAPLQAPQAYTQPQAQFHQAPAMWDQSQQQQQMMYQQHQRPDKASIMALYNHPQLAPQKPVAQQAVGQNAGDTIDLGFGQAQSPAPPRRTVSTPLPGSKNPFMMANGGGAAAMGASNASMPRSEDLIPGLSSASSAHQHASRESMLLGMDMAWTTTNGRHSPDAFASLSARAGR